MKTKCSEQPNRYTYKTNHFIQESCIETCKFTYTACRFFKAIRRFSAFRRWHFVLWWYLFRVPFLLMLEIYQNHSEAQYKTVSFHSLCAASSRFLFTCAMFNKNSFLCCVFFAIATIQYMCVWAKCSCND